ncbi:bifunctional diaminohydroxyphosphoribosylaminopyrimidine deaminase/5-amino-6-(5-phosphoribosylamino)uracil reductase RibD [Luteimonas sp. XNQY3]|nr:bifunctional diaminohydroxyphosphoribosylaminopyrimidine deaminase/5-amino-6-(5-phosphoribosylamino)uracil reductase RibD [Luteimonas sp. XNQY3]MCD9006564.1 bifunctional diaminohydroxyphosphoribosylaminopyrimidine deaminase/5-amino-6-(5-phosphoribosylamino)uracil reductase RibD [Luteimonas sp. XNQY3]
MTAFSADDHRFMAQALRLAERGAWTTRPNPMVGCVLVAGGEVVGEGFHVQKGGPHAEVVALQAAGDRARGATAYVTLEPCAHTGSTGPCADALIEAGVSRVVAAMRDPFPQVDGAGFDRLQAAGIAVESGLMEMQARALNRGYLSRIERGRPWLRIKLACSLDGRTAMANGVSKWISGPASRADVMRWRARAGALLTGSGTVLADDPQLTVRLEASALFRPPLRVVLDAGLSSVGRAQVRDAAAPTLYLHAPGAQPPAGPSIAHAAVPLRDGRLDLAAVMATLAARQVNEVHVEAGATLAGALLAQDLVDEIVLYIAPVLLGDAARPLFAGLDITSMAARCRLEVVDRRVLGEDTRLVLRRAAIEEP